MMWRKWVYDQLVASAALPAASIYSTLRDETPKVRPFAVIRFATETPQITSEVSTFQDVVIWVHDDPGGYTAIDEVIKSFREALEGPVTDEGGIFVTWQGDSPDFSDDMRGTVVRNSSFRLVGRR